MKANKVVVTITVEALSIDAVPGLVSQAVEQIQREMVPGELEADDGDAVLWKTSITPVEF